MFKEPAMFKDREAAGRALSRKLGEFLAESQPAMTQTPSKRRARSPVVVAIPRGGIPLSRIVADDLKLELDICLVRRIPGPTSRRGASIAAVTEQGDILLSQPSSWGVSRKYIEGARVQLLEDISRRRRLYNTKPMSLRKRDVIIVDDCVASGASMLAAIHTIKKQKPARIIIATPFCSVEAKARLASKCDSLVVLYVPPVFNACAQFYVSFPPVTDLEVIDCLRAQRDRSLVSNLARVVIGDHDLQHVRNQLVDACAGQSGAAPSPILVKRDSSGIEDLETKSRASSDSVYSTSSNEEEPADKKPAEEFDIQEDSFRVHRAISWQNALDMDEDEAAALGFAPLDIGLLDHSALFVDVDKQESTQTTPTLDHETRLSNTMVEVTATLT